MMCALTLPGHAGGPPINGHLDVDGFVDAVAQAIDRAGFERAHLVGNSLGGYAVGASLGDAPREDVEGRRDWWSD